MDNPHPRRADRPRRIRRAPSSRARSTQRCVGPHRPSPEPMPRSGSARRSDRQHHRRAARPPRLPWVPVDLGMCWVGGRRGFGLLRPVNDVRSSFAVSDTPWSRAHVPAAGAGIDVAHEITRPRARLDVHRRHRCRGSRPVDDLGCLPRDVGGIHSSELGGPVTPARRYSRFAVPRWGLAARKMGSRPDVLGLARS
jgi:hypothetical protein